jgi:predicted dehydrogenase
MRESARAPAGPGCRAFADHRELLDAGIADAFVVASPNHTHRAVLDDLLEAGQPVLVEKPLCTTLEDCQAVLARAARGAAPVWVAMEYRYMPAVARLLERVRAGDIGALRMVSIREHRFPFLAKVGDWNRFNRFTGGTLVEKCCHFFDLMRLMVRAEPTRVFASGSQDVNHLEESYAGERPDILDNAIVTVEFAGGVRAVLELCMFAEGSYFQEQIAAIGDQAKLEARVPGPGRFEPDGAHKTADVTLAPRATRRRAVEHVEVDEALLAAGDHQGSTYYQHQRFLEVVRGAAVPEVSLLDGLRAVAMGLAAQRSIATGAPVAIDWAAPDGVGLDGVARDGVARDGAAPRGAG